MENSALIQQNYLILIAGFFILGGIALFLISFRHERLQKDGPHALKKESDEQDDLAERYKKIINDAHSQARTILDSTSDTSAGIIADSKATNEHLAADLDHVLQNIAEAHITHLKATSDAFSASYDEKLNKLQEELKNHTEQAIKESETRVSESLEKFLEPLAANAAKSHSAIDERTQELSAQIEKELADYKAARMAKIESEIQELVKKTYREVLRKTIPDSLQEQLVLESLEKAKLEGIAI